MYQWACRGWKSYYVNFMFDPFRGPGSELIPHMRKAIHKFYGRFSGEFVRDQRNKNKQDQMPKLWLFPDLPVFKYQKQSLREVTINNGLHFNGPLLIPPVSRFSGCPINHIKANHTKYARHGINRIHITAVWDIPGLADYAAKTLKYNRADKEDIIVLPRLLKELPETKRVLLDPTTQAIKDIQSRFNLSTEIARNIVNDEIQRIHDHI